VTLRGLNGPNDLGEGSAAFCASAGGFRIDLSGSGYPIPVAIPLTTRIEMCSSRNLTISDNVTFGPRGLAVYYPYPPSIPAWQAAAAIRGCSGDLGSPRYDGG